MRITRIEPEAIDYLPYEAMEYLRMAESHSCGDLSVEDACQMARQGISQIFIVTDNELLACFCAVYGQGRNGRILDIALLGGKNARKWKSQVREFCINLAKSECCTQLMIIGRKGWGKIFTELQPIGMVYSLKID